MIGIHYSANEYSSISSTVATGKLILVEKYLWTTVSQEHCKVRFISQTSSKDIEYSPDLKIHKDIIMHSTVFISLICAMYFKMKYPYEGVNFVELGCGTISHGPESQKSEKAEVKGK